MVAWRPLDFLLLVKRLEANTALCWQPSFFFFSGIRANNLQFLYNLWICAIRACEPTSTHAKRQNRNDQDWQGRQADPAHGEKDQVFFGKLVQRWGGVVARPGGSDPHNAQYE